MLIKVLKSIIVFIIYISFLLPALGFDGFAKSPGIDWSVIRTLHFDIYYSGESDFAQYSAKIAEDSFLYLADYFKHEISGTVPVIIDSHGYCDECRLSYSAGQVNKIIISFDGSYAAFHAELTHNLVHFFQYDIIYGKMPGRDIHSGGFYFNDTILEYMADYLSAGYDRQSDIVIRDIANSEKAYTMDVRLLNERSGILREGLSFFFFLESAFGEDIISELLLNIRDYNTIYKAISITTGLSIKDLNAKWIDFYRKRNAEVNDEKKITYPSFIGEDKNISVLHKGDGKIVLLDLATGKKIKEIKIPFNAIKDAALSADSKYLVFIGVSFSSADVYLYDITNNIITRITNDLFTKKLPKISTDNSSIVFLSNENTTNNLESNIYKLINTDLKTNKRTLIVDNYRIGGKEIKYPASYFNQNDIALRDYSEDRDINITLLGSGTYWNNGFAGSANFIAADFLNEYKFSADADFLKDGNDLNNASNIDIDYEYMKYTIDFGSGFFYRSNPLEIYPDYKGEILQQYPSDINSTFFGSYVFTGFEFTKELLIRLKGSAIRYDDLPENNQKNISMELSLSLGYDSLAYRFGQPDGGARAGLSVTRYFSLRDNDISADIITFNFLKIFRFDRIVFSVKGGAGRIFGRDEDYFNFHLGGFNTIKGHGLFVYSGSNAFLMDAELKFIMLKKLIIRWPVVFRLNEISMIFFADFGSAWNTDFALFNSETHEFQDLKSSLGTGLRFSINDHVVFKLDAVWPYYYKSFGQRELVSGFELYY